MFALLFQIKLPFCCSKLVNCGTCPAGNAEATQQYADLMWRPGSPQGYQPPTLHLPAPSSRLDSHAHNSSRLLLERVQRTRSQPLSSTERHSSDNTQPGTPPTSGGYHLNSANAIGEPVYGYQPLLEPLLPVSDLLQSAASQQPAQDHQAFRGAAHPPVKRAQSFPIAPFVPAPASPLQRPPSHHSQSPQPSEPSQGALPGLNVPLEPHEKQLLNNLLHRSNSTRSQDRFSDHSQSSTSTHMDSQPLSLPRSWSARRLTSGSLMLHDTSALQDPHDLSRYTLNLPANCLAACTYHNIAIDCVSWVNFGSQQLKAKTLNMLLSCIQLKDGCSSFSQWLLTCCKCIDAIYRCADQPLRCTYCTAAENEDADHKGGLAD